MNGFASYAPPRVEICADCGEEFTPSGAFRLDIKDGATPLCDRCENKPLPACGNPSHPADCPGPK